MPSGAEGVGKNTGSSIEGPPEHGENRDRCVQRKQDILDAAMSCFADEGYFQTTNRKIARKAGITEGLIYHYFPSKKALLLAIIEEKFRQDRSPPQRCYTRWEPEFERNPPDPLRFREFLIDLGRSTFEGLEKDRDVLRILLSEYRLLDEGPEPLFPKLVMERSTNRFSRILERYFVARGLRGQSAGLKDTFFIGPIVSVFIFQDLLQGHKVRNIDKEAFLKELVDHFMAGIDGEAHEGPPAP